MTLQEFYVLSGSLSSDGKSGDAIAYGQAMDRPEWGASMAFLVPEHMQRGVAIYILFGIQTGTFLENLLIGDLFAAVRTADDINRYKIGEIATFLMTSAPAGSFGNAELRENWMNRGGMFPREVA